MHIQLLKPHTHGGQMLAPGDSLHLAEDLARWLIDCSVACGITDTPVSPNTPKVTLPTPPHNPIQPSNEERSS